MRQSIASIRALVIGLLLAFGAAGCAPVVISHRFQPCCQGPVSLAKIEDGELAPCHCGNLVEHFSHLAGKRHPLLQGADSDRRGAFMQPFQETVRPPLPRFHPVPTRPVFSPAGDPLITIEFDHSNSPQAPHVEPMAEPQPLPAPMQAPAEIGEQTASMAF